MPSSAIVQAINNCTCAVISGHTNPDGDSIGACMALAMAIEKLGKKVWVVLEKYNKRFDIIPGARFLYHGHIELLKPDTFIALDCGDADRLGSAGILLQEALQTLNIDHHMSNTRFAKLNFVDSTASSASEMVYRLLNHLNLLDFSIASALYAGMVCDTGGFRHESTTLDTLSAVGTLMAFNIPFSRIYNELMHIRTIEETKAMGLAISRMKLYANGKIAYTYVSREDMAEIGIGPSDLGGICEYILNTVGVRIAVFIYHKNEGCKISLRSVDVAINMVAAHFGGGGHELAAGCNFEGTIEAAFNIVVDMLLPLLKE